MEFQGVLIRCEPWIGAALMLSPFVEELVAHPCPHGVRGCILCSCAPSTDEGQAGYLDADLQIGRCFVLGCQSDQRAQKKEVWQTQKHPIASNQQLHHAQVQMSCSAVNVIVFVNWLIDDAGCLRPWLLLLASRQYFLEASSSLRLQHDWTLSNWQTGLACSSWMWCWPLPQNVEAVDHLCQARFCPWSCWCEWPSTCAVSHVLNHHLQDMFELDASTSCYCSCPLAVENCLSCCSYPQALVSYQLFYLLSWHAASQQSYYLEVTEDLLSSCGLR
jgi:hypothetical protein